ncbi:MAG: ABC transporter ATP-binding protein [Clostridia bacterium]|nr:ABC transporter ATP-binding protein [Clostridia bacterium]
MKIEICGISKRYGKKTVLRDISFSAESGKCIGILGGNGCGKSTLLSILAGIQKCDGGSFTCYNGESVNDNSASIDLLRDTVARSNLIGYVPQGTPLIEELTAKDNLSLWYTKEDMKHELEFGVLGMLGIGEFLKTTVSKMSGGMKKRLSIGCSVSKKPPVLLLDEPMAALDLVCKKSISEYLNHYKASGGIIIISTHDVIELGLCDEWYIMKNGVLTPFCYTGDIDELVKNL